MPLNSNTDRVFIDPAERWLLTEEDEGREASSPVEEFEDQDTRTYKLTASPLADGNAGQARPAPALLGRYVGKPEVAFSPKGTWLVVATKKGKECVTQMWRVHDFAKPVAEWRIPSEPPESVITFDSEERFLVVGPSSFIVPVYDAPAAQLAALFVDLRRPEPKAQQFAISTSGYRSTCGSSPDSRNCDAIQYTFSSDGRWLATSDPGNIWFVGGGRVRPALTVGNGFPVFSPDCRWMVSVDGNGTRLWRLDGEAPDDRGVLGPNGSVRFTKDSKHLLMLASGQINTYTLSLEEVIKKGENYVGRNLAWEEWSREFPKEKYGKVFPEYPPHLSLIENLILRGQQAAHKGDGGVASKAFRDAGDTAIQNKSVNACISVVEAGSEQVKLRP